MQEEGKQEKEKDKKRKKEKEVSTHRRSGGDEQTMSHVLALGWREKKAVMG